MRYLLSDVARITNGELVGLDREIYSISTDSRSHANPNAMFVAIKGVARDGHDYIKEMYYRGIKAFLVSDKAKMELNDTDSSFVVVQNTIQALQDLAAYHREQYAGELVAITGSNGKTIVKEWFAQLWDPGNGKLLRSPMSYNSQLGVALSLLMIEGDESLVLIEAGISEPGEMERLERMIKPTGGVLTNIGTAHLHNFDSKLHLQEEKMSLFQGCKWFLTSDQSISDINQQNIELVERIYQKLGLSHKPFDQIQPIAMRLEIKDGINGSSIINDSYISDVTSLEIALDYQNRVAKGDKVLVFSDFNGSYEKVTELVREYGIRLFVGIGQELCDIKDKFPKGSEFYNTTEDFLKNFDTSLISNSSVLVKGERRFAFERIANMLESRTHTTVLEIDLGAMIDNLNSYRSMIADECKIMVMVKANSYGSGLKEVGSMLQRQGVDYLAVAFVDEGIELRKTGVHLPIVVLNADMNSYRAMIEYKLEPEIYSFKSLENFIKEVNAHGLWEYPVHLKLDTGMHRLGFEERDIDRLNTILGNQNHIKVATIFSHFAASEDPEEDDFSKAQIIRFKSMADRLPEAEWHICNSSAIERFPEAHFEMVRLGIGLYSGEKVAATLKTKMVQIKELNVGDTVGYNRRGKISRPTRIGTLPIGYADGFTRKLSCGRGYVNVHGILCPIIGNICMDLCMIDLTEVPNAKEGDEVIIFGEYPTVEEFAEAAGTIPYEVLTNVNSRIKRIYIGG